MSRARIFIAARDYCEDVKRATGDVVLSPELLAEIIMKHAQEMAVAAICLFANAEDIPPGNGQDAFDEAMRHAIAAAERGE